MNVSPSILMDAIETEVKRYGKTLPITVVSGEGEKVSFKINPAIEAKETDRSITPERISVSFGSNPETAIKIDFSKVVVPYYRTSESGVVTKDKYHTLFQVDDLPLDEVFKLARIARELSVLSQDLLLTKLITRTDLESVIPLSGKLLYNNIVNPESFKSEAAEKFKNIREELEKRSTKADSSVISNSLKSIDDIVNVNFLLHQYKRVDDIKFIKFCKEHEKKNFIDRPEVKEDDIKDAESTPVTITSADPNYMPIGNSNINNRDNTMIKSLGLMSF